MSAAEHTDSPSCMWHAWSDPPNILLPAIARAAVWLTLSHQTRWRILFSESCVCFLLLSTGREHSRIQLPKGQPGAEVTPLHAKCCPHPSTPVHGGQRQGVGPGPALILGLQSVGRDGGKVLVYDPPGSGLGTGYWYVSGSGPEGV